MRKSKILFVLDHIIWFIIALLPIIIYIIGNINHEITLNSILVSLGIDTSSNILYQGLVQIFYGDTAIQIFSSTTVVLKYIVYMAFVEILHLFVDTMLFIPKFLNKFLTKILGEY